MQGDDYTHTGDGPQETVNPDSGLPVYSLYVGSRDGKGFLLNQGGEYGARRFGSENKYLK